MARIGLLLGSGFLCQLLRCAVVQGFGIVGILLVWWAAVAVLAALLAAVAAVAVLRGFAAVAAVALVVGCGGFGGFGFAAAEQFGKPGADAGQQAGFGRLLRHGGGAAVFDAFYGGLGFHRLSLAADFQCLAVVFFGDFDLFVAGLGIIVHIVGAHAGDVVVRVFQMGVGNHQDGYVQPLFQAEQLGAFFVEQEGGHVHRHLGVHFFGVVLHRLFLDDAQHVQGGGFDAADHAGTGAARAGHVAAFAQGGAQALAGKLKQAEAGEFAHLHAGAVFPQRVAQGVFHIALVLGVFHVDEVDHDQAAQVAQAHLAGHFFGGFHIGLEGGFFDVGTAGGAGGVHVYGNQGFGVVDHDGAAGGQAHGAREGAFDLVLDLEAGEERDVVVVVFELAYVVRHHIAHEFLHLAEHFAVVDEDFADVGAVVVADGADEQGALHEEEVGVLMGVAGFFDGAPQLQ